MGWGIIFENLVQYGVAGIVAGVLLWLLARTLKGFMSGLKEDRDNYMKIIEGQTITQQNHMGHLDDTIGEQSKIIATQGERYTSGVEKICDALKSQTDILKEHIKGK